MQSPYKKIEMLAELCNVDKGTVSRCLKNFVDSMKKYFEWECCSEMSGTFLLLVSKK